MLGKNIRVLKVIGGEIIITEVKDVDDEGMWVIEYPALIVPIPQEHGGQPGQIGFAKYMPFSDYSKVTTFNPRHIISDTVPHSQILGAYEQWVKHARSQDSGIVIPNMKSPNIPQQGKGTPSFSKLNIGRR